MYSQRLKCLCDVCGGRFGFGPRVLDGKYVKAYKITVCSSCYSNSWEGWAPQFEALVTRKLQEQGLALPARNSKGLLPRDG